jgi:hypothetical protein
MLRHGVPGGLEKKGRVALLLARIADACDNRIAAGGAGRLRFREALVRFAPARIPGCSLEAFAK